MDEQKENKNLRTDAVHPAVLKVTGEKTRRWCAAIWSVSPGEQRLIVGIRGLIDGTLIAHWMQPPAQFEPEDQLLNSVDLVFYESVDPELGAALKAEGWKNVQVITMASDEYEQFQVLAEEAKKQGRTVASRPSDLWRVQVEQGGGDEALDFEAIDKVVANEISDEAWGESPGSLSFSYCSHLAEQAGSKIGPSFEGLQRFESLIVSSETDGVQWLGPIRFQALCDYVAVVMQAGTALEVQWGVSSVDKTTGLAPAPMVRIRSQYTPWRNIALGRDVLRAICVPWGRDDNPGERLTSLIGSYEHDCLGG